jgi:hypothetical protein
MHFRVIAATALAGLALAGCGGDDEGDSNQALSYSEFSAEANEICKEEGDKINATTDQLSGDPAKDAPIWEEAVEQIRAANERFAQLDPPEELQADFDRFNAAASEQLGLAEDAQAAAETGDAQAYRAFIKQLEKSNVDEESDLAGSKLGAAECAGDDENES